MLLPFVLLSVLVLTSSAGRATVAELTLDSDDLNIQDIVPGTSRESTHVVGLGPDRSAARLALEISDLVQREEQCTSSEVEAGDSTCGDGVGELANWLTVEGVLTPGADCSAPATVVLPTTRLADIATSGLVVLDDEVIPAGGARCLVLTWAFDFGTDNTTQTDAVDFTLTVLAEDDPSVDVDGDATVLGNDVDRDGSGGNVLASGGSSRAGALPSTGAAVVGLLGLAAGAGTLGTALLRRGRRGRSS